MFIIHEMLNTIKNGDRKFNRAIPLSERYRI